MPSSRSDVGMDVPVNMLTRLRRESMPRCRVAEQTFHRFSSANLRHKPGDVGDTGYARDVVRSY
jgi:hypothetical protein